MAELTLDLRGVPRSTAYADLDAHLDAVLEGIHDRVAVALVAHAGVLFILDRLFLSRLTPGA